MVNEIFSPGKLPGVGSRPTFKSLLVIAFSIYLNFHFIL